MRLNAFAILVLASSRFCVAQDTGEAVQNGKPRQRFTFAGKVPVECRTLDGIVVGEGRRAFAYFRGGGGLITCGISPCGISVHNEMPGPALTGPCNDRLMAMDYIDAYVRLEPLEVCV